MQPAAVLRLYAMALAAVAIYGATPLFTKVAVGSTDGTTVGALRALVAAPVAVPLILAGRHRFPPTRRAVAREVVHGVGGTIGRAAGREGVCRYVYILAIDVSRNKKN